MKILITSSYSLPDKNTLTFTYIHTQQETSKFKAFIVFYLDVALVSLLHHSIFSFDSCSKTALNKANSHSISLNTISTYSVCTSSSFFGSCHTPKTENQKQAFLYSSLILLKPVSTSKQHHHHQRTTAAIHLTQKRCIAAV